MTTRSRERQILTEAAIVIRNRGYHGASMQEIAERCGLPKAGLYHYFKSKEEILDKILNGSIGSFAPGLQEIVSSDLDPVEKLRRAIYHHTITLCENLAYCSVMLQEIRSLPDSLTARQRDERHRYLDMFRLIIEDGVAAGQFRPVSVPTVSLALLGMLNWTFQWYSPGGPLAPSQIADIFWGLISTALWPREGTKTDQ